MDASDLKVFETVAQLGGMNRAASVLNTVQSNVTARIRMLEDELRSPLFIRHSRGVTLTPAGQRLLPFAPRVRQILQEAARAVKEDGTPKGQLLIGSLETTAALRLSPILAAYASAYPQVDLVLSTGTSRELAEAVLDRRLEGAFVCGPVDHPELHTEFVTHEELVILTAPSVTGLEELIGRDDLKIIVLRVGCSYRQHLESLLAKRGVIGLRRLEFGTLEAIVGCVSAGLGVTLLPKSLIGTVWRSGQVAAHELPPAEAKVETVFVRRHDAFISSAMTAFLGFVRSETRHSEAAE